MFTQSNVWSAMGLGYFVIRWTRGVIHDEFVEWKVQVCRILMLVELLLLVWVAWGIFVEGIQGGWGDRG